MQFAEIVRNVLYGLTDDLAISDYRIPCASVGEEVVKRHAVDEIGNKAHCHHNMADEC